jgi:hypothetical protein
VNAFWSVTMYDGKSQFLIKNPINRYLTNSPMLTAMKKNADGSLTLYIQKNSPGADKESNWLPAPADSIYLVMRLYWPKPETPSILPVGEGSWKPPASFRRTEGRIAYARPAAGLLFNDPAPGRARWIPSSESTPGLASDGGLTPFFGPNSNCLFDRQHKNLPVADLPGPSRLDDGFDSFPNSIVRYKNFKLYLRRKLE